MLNRRHFLTQLAATGSLFSCNGAAPSVFALAAEASKRTDPHNQQVLLIVFLGGGNDGLNTVVPQNDPQYRQLRKELSLQKERILSIDQESALHPTLRGLADVWEAGRLAIVQGVGYPNHNRSHFHSTAIWHAARLDATPNGHDGWIGRALDPVQAQVEQALTCSVGLTETPRVLSARQTRCVTPPDVPIEQANELASLLSTSKREPQSESERFVERLRGDATASLRDLSTRMSTTTRFPDTELGRRLSQIAWLISRDNPARVYYVEQNGYDTHAGQLNRHAILLKELGDALRAFDRSAVETGDAQRVTTLVFSEFGRRVEENDSGGTDHGAAGPVFLLGGGVRGGMYGERPNLHALSAGDVEVTTDFRQIYSTLLSGVLNVDPTDVLGQAFKTMPILQTKS